MKQPKMDGPFLPHKPTCSQKNLGSTMTPPKQMGLGYFCVECGVRLGFLQKQQATDKILSGIVDDLDKLNATLGGSPPKSKPVKPLVSIQSMTQEIAKLPNFLADHAENIVRTEGHLKNKLTKVISVTHEGNVLTMISAVVKCKCGQPNRIRMNVPGLEPKCGKCKEAM